MQERATILIAEDDRFQLDLMTNDFVDAGYNVLGFSDGADIFDKANEYQPDLIVLDISLPNVDGWEVARKLHGNSNTRNIPVVVVSGCSIKDGASHALIHGCIDFYEKPCDTSKIMKKIEAYVRMGRIKRRTSDLYARL